MVVGAGTANVTPTTTYQYSKKTLGAYAYRSLTDMVLYGWHGPLTALYVNPWLEEVGFKLAWWIR